jgi:hypothetical protein
MPVNDRQLRAGWGEDAGLLAGSRFLVAGLEHHLDQMVSQGSDFLGRPNVPKELLLAFSESAADGMRWESLQPNVWHTGVK